jgi:hypothetical protein
MTSGERRIARVQRTIQLPELIEKLRISFLGEEKLVAPLIANT